MQKNKKWSSEEKVKIVKEKLDKRKKLTKIWNMKFSKSLSLF